MTPSAEFLMSRLLLQAESTGNDSLTSDWYPGALLVLVIFGIWLLWRYTRRTTGRKKLP